MPAIVLKNSRIIGTSGITLNNTVFNQTAVSLQNIFISNILPTDGQTLVYQSSSNTYIPKLISGSGTVNNYITNTTSSIYYTTGMSSSNSKISAYNKPSSGMILFNKAVDTITNSTSSALQFLTTSNQNGRVLVSGSYGGIYEYDTLNSALKRSSDSIVSGSIVYVKNNKKTYLCTLASIGTDLESPTKVRPPYQEPNYQMGYGGTITEWYTFGISSQYVWSGYQEATQNYQGRYIDIYAQDVSMYNSPQELEQTFPYGYQTLQLFARVNFDSTADGGVIVRVSNISNNIPSSGITVTFSIMGNNNNGYYGGFGNNIWNDYYSNVLKIYPDGFYHFGSTLPTNILTALYTEVESSSYSYENGNMLTASGFGSIAYGNYSKATQNFSIAEGNFTNASGLFSHAEGDRTTAAGWASHAAGISAAALGKGSFAAGLGTIASTDSTFTIGKYNNDGIQEGVGLFVVGNGTSEGSRSNILEVSSDRLRVKGNIYADSYNGISYPYDLYGNYSGSLIQSGTLLSTWLMSRYVNFTSLSRHAAANAGTVEFRVNNVSRSLPWSVSENNLVQIYTKTSGSVFYYTLKGTSFTN